MTLHEQLTARYKAIYKPGDTPWAFPIVPTVPYFDEENFVPGTGILVYGSAESLYWYPQNGGWPEWLLTAPAWDRHKFWFDRWLNHDPEARPGSYFPFIHLEPVNGGGLVVAAAFLSTLTGRVVADDPVDFFRTVAFANFGKFAVEAKVNVDYPEDLPKLRASLPYVEVDLAVLRPALVLMPHVMLRTLRAAGEHSLLATSTFIPARQFQHWPLVDCKRDYLARGDALLLDQEKQAWANWTKRIDSRLRSRIWYYLADVEAGWLAARS
jgi:hypothetical protein